MAKTISSMTVVIGGNISGLSNSFSRGAKDVEGFSSRVGAASSSVSGFAAGIPKVTNLLGGLGIAMSAASIVGMVKGQLEAVDVVAKLSDRLGIATESIVGLQHAADLAGVSNEELTGGLEKMLKTLGLAAGGSKSATAALAAVGLSAEDVKSMEPAAAFSAIAEGLTNMEDPAARAKAAMDIFGKSGQSLLPLLMSGAAGLADAQREAEKFGLTFSRMDAAQVEEANDAVTQLSAATTALARDFAIMLAPAIQAAADATRGLASTYRGLRDALHDDADIKRAASVQALSEKLGQLTDEAHQAKNAFEATPGSASWAAETAAAQKYLDKLQEQSKVAQQVDAAAKKARDDALAAAQDVPWYADPESFKANKTRQAMQLPETLHTPKYYEELNQKIAAATDQVKTFSDAQADAQTAAKEATAAQAAAAKAATQAAANAVKEQEQHAQSLVDKLAQLEAAARTAGMSGGQRQIFELKQEGASPAQLEQAQRFLDQAQAAETAAKAMEEQKKVQADLADEAKGYFDSTRTDAEKYAAELERINELQVRGLLDADTAQRAADAAQKAMQGVATKPALAKAVIAGSAEAQALKFSNGPRLMPIKGTKDAANALAPKLLAEAQKQTRTLDRIADSVEDDTVEELDI